MTFTRRISSTVFAPYGARSVQRRAPARPSARDAFSGGADRQLTRVQRVRAAPRRRLAVGGMPIPGRRRAPETNWADGASSGGLPASWSPAAGRNAPPLGKRRTSGVGNVAASSGGK